ncbi:hypothetical protein H7F33_17525 [Pedobacter sp. PAMC26386]|nr:hypothetical protein H7F33_17525 [Pedobacter sp. PAMC26386]
MIFSENDYLKLYAHNIAVKGSEQSAIYNLQEQKITLIPNILYELILTLESQPVKVIRDQYNEENMIFFDRYVEFILEKDLGFLTREPNSFPLLDQVWDSPGIINNAILEYDFKGYDMLKVVEELNLLGCRHLELRLSFHEARNIQAVQGILSLFNNKVFKSITILIAYHDMLSLELIESIYQGCSKITHIIVYNYNKPEKVCSVIENIKFLRQDLSATVFNSTFPSDKYFVNRLFFMESLYYNVFYNKKVTVNRLGEIKNHLSLKETFGNINDISIKAVLDSTRFKELWGASNDKIEGIKDSALRYCTFITNELIKVSEENYQILY